MSVKMLNHLVGMVIYPHYFPRSLILSLHGNFGASVLDYYTFTISGGLQELAGSLA